MKTSIKLLLLGLILTIGTIFTFQSCQKENEQTNETVSKETVNKLLSKKFDLIDTSENSAVFLKFKSNTDDMISVYKDKYSETRVIIVSNSKNPSNLSAYKGDLINDEFIVEKEIQLSSNLDKNGNGSIIVKNITENIEFETFYSAGKIINTEIYSYNYENTKVKLCQREGSESFNQCFNRESDEFCDDFVSTIAYITNPSIPVIIATLCSC